MNVKSFDESHCSLEQPWSLAIWMISDIQYFVDGLWGNYYWNLVFNSLWPSDVIWWQGSRSTLAQVMACCLKAPSHYLNQCWLMIIEVLWHSPDSNFIENTSDFYRWNEFEIYKFETVVKYPRWVKFNHSDTYICLKLLCFTYSPGGDHG